MPSAVPVFGAGAALLLSDFAPLSLAPLDIPEDNVADFRVSPVEDDGGEETVAADVDDEVVLDFPLLAAGCFFLIRPAKLFLSANFLELLSHDGRLAVFASGLLLGSA
jgi:hypothetical protein